MATTNNCICEGRGIVHIEVMPGVKEIANCKCQPPEYWAERQKASWDEFQNKLAIARVELGMNDNEQTEIPGGQKYQIS